MLAQQILTEVEDARRLHAPQFDYDASVRRRAVYLRSAHSVEAAPNQVT
jgi:hypothetical protein